jgi:hypothetical protein
MFGLRIAGSATIAGADNPDTVIPAIGMYWPNKGAEITDWDINVSGKPIIDDDNFQYGRDEPEFSVEMPVTEASLAYSLTGLLQSEAYAVGPPITYTPIIWTTPVPATPLYHVIEGGIAGAAAYSGAFKVVGCIPKEVAISLPPSGADGGKATITTTWIGRSTTRGANFAGTPTNDSSTKKLSKDHSLLISTGNTQAALAAADFTQLDITMRNNAVRSPVVGEYADAYILGRYEAEGTLSVLLTETADEEYDNLYDAYEAGTVLAMQFGVDPTGMNAAGEYNIVHHINITGEPTHSEQGNAVVAAFPFRAAYDSTDQSSPGVCPYWKVAVTSDFVDYSA